MSSYETSKRLLSWFFFLKFSFELLFLDLDDLISISSSNLACSTLLCRRKSSRFVEIQLALTPLLALFVPIRVDARRLVVDARSLAFLCIVSFPFRLLNVKCLL